MENDEEVCKAKQTEDSPTSNADISLDDSLTLLSTLSHEQLLSLVSYSSTYSIRLFFLVFEW